MEAPVKVLDPAGHELKELVETRLRLVPNARPLRILMPFDGSPASLRAVRYAGDCLAGLPVHVQLLNVQSPVLDDPALLHAAYAMLEGHRREGRGILDTAERVLRAAHVPFDSEVVMASPVEAIVRAAVRHSSHLVLMGTRGRSPLVNLLARSVPSRVVQRSPVPVLLVRVQEAMQPQPVPPRPPFIAA